MFLSMFLYVPGSILCWIELVCLFYLDSTYFDLVVIYGTVHCTCTYLHTNHFPQYVYNHFRTHGNKLLNQTVIHSKPQRFGVTLIELRSRNIFVYNSNMYTHTCFSQFNLRHINPAGVEFH